MYYRYQHVQTLSYMHVFRNTHDLSEKHSSMIQISSKVFSLSVCEKQRSLVLFLLWGQTCHGGGRCITEKFLPGGKIVTGKIIPGGRFVTESISHATPVKVSIVLVLTRRLRSFEQEEILNVLLTISFSMILEHQTLNAMHGVMSQSFHIFMLLIFSRCEKIL